MQLLGGKKAAVFLPVGDDAPGENLPDAGKRRELLRVRPVESMGKVTATVSGVVGSGQVVWGGSVCIAAGTDSSTLP